MASLPEVDGPIKNGEENEKSIITLRAKLYKLTKTAAPTPDELQEKSKTKKAKTVGIQMATKVGLDEEEKGEEDDATNSGGTGTDGGADGTGTGTGTASATDASSSAMDWKEVGIGPLRVLTDDTHTRIVQRRENTPGGQGTKLILNLPLKDECSVEKRGDKFVRLAAFEIIEDIVDAATGDAADASEGGDESGVKFEPVQYLFKVKTADEANSLFSTLKKFCGQA